MTTLHELTADKPAQAVAEGWVDNQSAIMGIYHHD